MKKERWAVFKAPENSLKNKRILGLFSRGGGMDMPCFILLILVLAVGLVCLFSASYAYSYYENNGDSYYYIKRQLIFAAIGVILMLAASTVSFGSALFR